MPQELARSALCSALLMLACLRPMLPAQEQVPFSREVTFSQRFGFQPFVWMRPLDGLVDPAHSQSLPERVGTYGHMMSFGGCVLEDGAPPIDAEVLRCADGTRSVRFWIPGLPSSHSLLSIQGLTLTPGEARFVLSLEAGARTLSWRATQNSPELRILQLQLVAYDATDRERTYKTFDHLYSCNGSELLTKGAGGEFTHHRGVFLGWNRVRAAGRELDFWHCKEPATIRHDRIASEKEWLGHSHALLVRRLRWCEGEETVLTERRSITAWVPWMSNQILDYEIELLAFQPIELDGDPHHGGFQIRAAQEVHDNPDATGFVRPAASQAAGNDIWSGGRWCAIRFPLAGETQQIAMLDHPQNGDPPQWSTRAYGRFGAFRRHTLQPGIPLVLRYRLIVAGDSELTRFTPQFLEARWREWIEPPTPKILR